MALVQGAHRDRNRLAGVAHHNRRVVVCGLWRSLDDSDFISEAIGCVRPQVLEGGGRGELVAAREAGGLPVLTSIEAPTV